MGQIQKWCLRYGWQLGLVCVAIYLAFLLRQEHSMALIEVYEFLSRPFQMNVSPQEYLQDAKFKELKFRIMELENQNAQLQQMLGVSRQTGGGEQWAPIIGRSGDAWWQQVLIGRGKSSGIGVGDVVQGQGGLVGRVINAAHSSSQVLLISDTTSQVGVMVSRSRVMGILRGKGQSMGSVELFVRDADVKPGDVVVTSPISSLFPQGIPVGRIRSVDLNRQPSPEAVIEFLAPLGMLEYVQVSRS